MDPERSKPRRALPDRQGVQAHIGTPRGQAGKALSPARHGEKHNRFVFEAAVTVGSGYRGCGNSLKKGNLAMKSIACNGGNGGNAFLINIYARTRTRTRAYARTRAYKMFGTTLATVATVAKAENWLLKQSLSENDAARTCRYLPLPIVAATPDFEPLALGMALKSSDPFDFAFGASSA
jgi:hypothetical protein